MTRRPADLRSADREGLDDRPPMRERPLARILAAAIAPGKPSAQPSDGRSMR